MDELFERTDSHVAHQVLSHAGTITDEYPHSRYDDDAREVVIGPNSDDEQIAHEYGHATVAAYGYSIEEYGHALTQFYNGRASPAIEFGRPMVDVYYEIAQDQIAYMEENGAPEDQIQQESQKLQEVLEFLDEDFGDTVLDKEDLMLTSDAEEGTPVDTLVQEVNNAWERQIEALQSEEADIGDYSLVAEYSSLNADETMAMLHESMQGGVGRPDTLENLYNRHDELLSAYLEIYEPGLVQKAMFNHLFDNFGNNAAFDERPYPEAEGVLEE